MVVMRVRAKVMIVLALLFVALIAAQWTIEQRLMLPKFVEMERASARTDMQRVAFAVEREQQALGAQAADWGNWRELWRYMRDRNRAFADASLTDISFRTAKINYMAVIDVNGRFVWSDAVRGNSKRPSVIRLNRDNHLEPAWSQALTQGQLISGLIATDAGVLVASGAPILDGMGHGPARGMVIMARLLDGPELLRLSTQSQVRLDMRAWGQDPALDAKLLEMHGSGHARLTESESATRIEQLFTNLSGAPLLVFGITVPRTITHHGEAAVRYSTLLLGVAAGVVLVTLLILLGRIVLSPLARMTDHAQRIAAADDMSARLAYRRSDELGALATAFDNMVERLARTRRELIDRSFESGAAENAGGVLHNLGNAMTPLAVNVAQLQRHLAAANTSDLHVALDELQRGSPEPERRRDLEQFVQLSAAELARTVDRGSERVRDITEQANVIQAVLAEQRQHQRNGPVLVPATPAELISLSLQQVALAHRERLDLVIDPAVAALGTLPLPCTTLGMVLQNLIQNAAEAAASVGMARTRLQISAEVLEVDGLPTLRIEISDDAAGVAAENLPKLFQKGYSTKSQATNSGLGLHWCANTLRALGGGISARSDGLGRGTRFEILVPLREPKSHTEERAA
jgi:two-component system, NtrC family, sensor kinase